MKNTHDLAKLQELLDTATHDLKKVTSKKMFGCYALWANESVFGLIWKHGRIGLKLPAESDYKSLMKISGAEPWKAGPMKMAHWVLLPESYHAKPALIKKWAHRSYELCLALPKKAVSLKKRAAKNS